MEKSIITVIGKDRVGIIATICTYLSKQNINILDITQTIVDGFFNMMMITDFSSSKKTFIEIENDLNMIAKEMAISISVQKEEIFLSMHRI